MEPFQDRGVAFEGTFSPNDVLYPCVTNHIQPDVLAPLQLARSFSPKHLCEIPEDDSDQQVQSLVSLMTNSILFCPFPDICLSQKSLIDPNKKHQWRLDSLCLVHLVKDQDIFNYKDLNFRRGFLLVRTHPPPH